MTTTHTWSDLIDSLWDWDGSHNHPLPGPCLYEWLTIIQHDLDEVDALYLDFDVIGG